MKKIMKNIFKAFAILLLVSTTYTVLAQGPPPPPGGSSNTGNNQLGGNAPIGGGLFILLSLGAAYGGRKLYQIQKENMEE